jgi:alpha-galactosidase
VVVMTVGVGGRRAWELDVQIPRKYGIYQPVGDTAMPGGISRAMRMIPALLDIAGDVKQLCPDAFFIN